ncbi:4-hydroxy-tetrahydrodipicolinate reductase [Mycoplasmatota bacterium]|nr:4-hydroxy-tetrahydrodipicolinate reductase [Mycoplasmatota bacterium]
MKILISGISGKMGQLVKSDVLLSNTFEFAGGFDVIEDYKGTMKFDAIIDFSHMSQTKKVIDFAVDNNTPLVIATTGLTDDDFEYIQKKSSEIAIFHSHNYAYGIQVLIKALNAILPMTDDFDIEITEKHHRYKADAPSGTAKTIMAEIKQHREEVKFIDAYQTKRQKNEIGVHAVRAGTIVGEHEILLASEDEMITIKHEALSKQIFSQGALRAAKFLENKTSGLYHMKDLV